MAEDTNIYAIQGALYQYVVEFADAAGITHKYSVVSFLEKMHTVLEPLALTGSKIEDAPQITITRVGPTVITRATLEHILQFMNDSAKKSKTK